MEEHQAERSTAGPTSVATSPRKKRLRTWLRRAAVALVLVVLGFVYVVVPVLASVLISRASTRPVDRDLPSTPKDFNADYTNVTFGTTDGVAISGWLLPSRERKTTIVFAHGLFRSRHEQLDRAMDFWKEGYGAILYDARNHGKSGTARVTLGYNERLDVEAAVRYAREKHPGDRIALLGISMGAVASLLAAAETPDVDAVIADSSFLTFEDTAAHHVGLLHLPAFPLANEVRELIAWRGGFSSAELSPLAAVRKLGPRPAMFIAAAHDRRMPPEVAEQLRDASTSPKRKLLVIDGPESYTHAHAYQADPQRYVAEVTSFLDAGP